MALTTLPLTDAERRHLHAIASGLLVGQRRSFWVCCNLLIAALAWLWVSVMESVGGLHGTTSSLLPPFALTWLALNLLYFWIRHRSRGLRADLRVGEKERWQGTLNSLRAEGNALVYEIDGHTVRTYPSLPRGQVFMKGFITIDYAACLAGAQVQLERTTHGHRLLSVGWPLNDGAVRATREATLPDDEQRQLRLEGWIWGCIAAVVVGGTGLLLNGNASWLWLWVAVAAMMLTLVRMIDSPEQWHGAITVHGQVTEVVHAVSLGPGRTRLRGTWIRVGGNLYLVRCRPAPGQWVRLRARLRADGCAGETTECSTAPPAAASIT